MSNKRYMRKWLVAGWLCCLLPLTAAAQQLSQRYNKERPLTIVCDWDKAPYEFMDDEGDPSGTNVEVLKRILGNLGVSYQFVMKEWGNAVKTFERGDADLILANVNRYKGKEYYSTQIINYNRIKVAMTSDTTDIISLNTLVDEGVVLKTGDYTAMYFKNIDSTKLSKIEQQSPKVALTSLLAGDAKYFVWGEEPLKWKIKKLHLEGIYLNEVAIPVSEVHIIGRDKELIDEIDDQYSRMKQNGDLEVILDSWMHPERDHSQMSPVVMYIIAGILLLTVLIYFFIRLAKSHVRAVTRSLTEVNEMMDKALLINKDVDKKHDAEVERAARNMEHKYERLSNLPFVATSFYDKDGWLLELNDQMKELCGMSDDNPVSKRFWEKVCMFDIPLFRNAYSNTDRNDLLVCQHMMYPEMDINHYVEFHVRPLFNADGDIVNYYNTTLDVTDMRNCTWGISELKKEIEQTAEQAKLHRERLIYLLENSARYIMRSDMRKQEIAFYRSPEAPIYVHSFEEFVDMLEPGQQESVRALLNDTQTKDPQYVTVNLVKRSDGQKGIVYAITFNPVKDQEGTVVGHEGIASDITKLYNAKIALEKQTKLANESVQLKSGFMASMTHELRTPLNAIVGFTSILEALDSPEERAEYVRIIRNSSDMLHRLINDIIEASSLTDGPTSIKPVDADFSAVFEDICLTLEQRVNPSGLTFEKDNPYDECLTTIDTERILQIMTNFVTNAVKFTKEGHIRVGYRSEDGGLRLYCEDTGMGIPKDKQQKIFERFVKLDEFVQGTGMGLAICKSIVENFGGKIGVKSDGLGKGSTFWIWVPCNVTVCTAS